MSSVYVPDKIAFGFEVTEVFVIGSIGSPLPNVNLIVSVLSLLMLMSAFKIKIFTFFYFTFIYDTL
jgi:hypothetical protein